MGTSKLLLPFAFIGLLVWGGLCFLAPELIGRISYARESARQRAITENLPNLKQADAMSELLRAVSENVRPAVVEVRVTRNESEGRRRLRRFESDSVGSGVIVDRENGYIVTNWHVIDQAEGITIVLADERKLIPQWVRFDEMTDLAVIKIAPDKLLDIPWGDSDQMEVGDQVLAVGSPMQLPQTVTFGRISAKGRMAVRSETYQDYLQTDAAINHGNSGGPLINVGGEIVGINTMIVSTSSANAGLGLAIPSNRAKRVTMQLIEDGKATRGFIGLQIDTVDQARARRMGLPSDLGALVTGIVTDGPGDRAGIEKGDFIVSIDSAPVANSQKFRHIVADIKPGTTVSIELHRDGETMILPVKIVPQPDNMREVFPR